MLTDDELLELLREGESDRVEFTREWKDADKIGRAICAFANDLPGHGKPGVVFVGVDDSGKPVGLTITNLLLQRLGEFKASGRILPLPSLTVGKRMLDGAEVAVVITEPHPHPPVRYKGECCVRIGPRQGRATPAEEMRLSEKGREGDQPFDQRLVRPPAFLDGLDMGNFRDYLRRAVSAETLAENMRDEEHQLMSHQFAGPGGQLYNSGLLCFAHDCDRRIPGAYVQFVRFPGTEMSDRPKVHQEIRGTIFQQMQAAEGLIETHIAAPAIIGKKTRVDFPEYPAAALRQLITNAVLHRSYEGELANTPAHFYWFDDHIEIRSPGGLYGGVSESDFGEPGVVGYRNPKLAEALKTMGFVERHGFGIYEARKTMEANGNLPPEFQLDGNRVTVVLRKLDLDALAAKAAKLACCNSLFHFHREREIQFIRIPDVNSLGGLSGYVGVTEHVPRDPPKTKKDVAIEAVREYTARHFVYDMDAVDPDNPQLENLDSPPFSHPIRMALIMYVLHKLFGAEESEMQEAFSESFHTPEEKKADEEEFRRLLEKRQPIAQMEEHIAREVKEPRINALLGR